MQSTNIIGFLSLKKTLVVCVFFFWSSLSCAASYTSITVFGDSTLDGGNDNTAIVSFYKLFGDPFPPNAGAPRVPFENFRYSDGLVSAEQMAKSLGLFNSVQFYNFAVGGALAKDLNSKIDTVYSDPKYANYPIDPTGLYVIEAGQVDLLRGVSTPEEASAYVINGVQNLYNRGARHFVVFNSFNLGYVPNYKNASATDIASANAVSTSFNTLLKTKGDALPFSKNILYFDNAKYLRNIQLNPARYGITNILDACIISTATGQYCSNRQEYIFWDTIHVTGRAQEILGLLLTDTVTYPNVSMMSPANNTNITVNTSYKLTASAKDGDGNITKVEFYDGAILLGTATSSPYNFDWTPTVLGQHTITAKAYDNDKKSTLSDGVNISVGASVNSPPAISLSLSSSVSGNTQGSVTATASDSDGTITKVEMYINNALSATLTATPYTFSWANAANGTYSITAKAYDNKLAVTTSNAIQVVVNSAATNAPPTVTLNQPVVANAGKTQGSITATASDSDGTITKVEMYINNALSATLTATPYTFSWANAANGTYSITAKAYDNKLAVTTSNAIQVVVNSAATNVPPTVFITSPTNNATATLGTTLNIAATATDSDGIISKVEFYDGSTLLKTDTTFPYSLGLTSPALGIHAITAKAYDNNNAVTMSSIVNVTVK